MNDFAISNEGKEIFSIPWPIIFDRFICFFFVFILLNKILPIKNKFEQTKHTFCFRRWDCNWATEWLTAFAISIYRNFVYIGMRYASVYVYAIRLYVSLVRLLDLWRVGIEAPLYWQFVMRSVNQHAYSEQESPAKNEKKLKIAQKRRNMHSVVTSAFELDNFRCQVLKHKF